MSDSVDRFFDERIETLPPGQLRKLQDHRLRWQFRRCWDGSAWYRERFEAAGLTPETFGGLADLERLPLLSADVPTNLDYAAWLVLPEAWIASYRHYSGNWRRLSAGDIQHEYDRLARANWAAVNWPVFDSWPPKYHTAKHRLRRYWPTWLAPGSRRRMFLLNEWSVGDFLAFECGERRGRHWVDDQFLAEIIDPTTDQPVSDGTLGYLVVTDLVREANPLIRYRTGLRRILTSEGCACGRTSTLIWTADQFRKARRG